MPTLPPMPDRFPPDVLEARASSGSAWRVARTRARQEKKLARWLASRKLPYFLPLRRKTRNWRGRRISSEEPLLPGYVFFVASDEQARLAMTSRCIVDRLDVADQPALLSELHALDRLAASGRAFAEAPGFAPQREVEIKAGPLAGLRGYVAAAAPGKVLLRLEILGRSLEVAVDETELEAV
ncbi:MAG TPA: transcription termination/antitermination NusG family protein [Planctomycetota bacterium]|nr:transcription termination/antitermination NusG family protein [Planctomycetota bacterium]